MTEKYILSTIDIAGLFKLLPHRYPFLMIDKIIEIDGDQSAIGIKNITINEPHFQGHFPSEPIMPGILVLEAMAQTAGAICANRHMFDTPKLVYLMTIDKAKFRKPALPGDVLKLYVKKSKQLRNIFKFNCVAKVDDAKIAEAVISAMMLDSSKEEPI